MSGLLRKAMAGLGRGIADSAPMIAQLSLEQYRTEILGEREARLRSYQTGERLATQEYQAGQLDKRLAAQGDIAGERLAETERHNRALESTAARGMDIRETAAETKASATKPVKYPQRQMILDAQDLIAGDPELGKLGADDQKKFAFNVATRTQKLLVENPGTDASEAMSMALEEETQNVSPGEQRSRFGLDWLARDKPPAYRDRRSEWLTPLSERQPTRIEDDEDYRKLPSGTRFIAPDGSVRIKP